MIFLCTIRMWLIHVFFMLVTCPSLTAPNNGMINCSVGDGGANHRGTCTVKCKTGYQLMGSSMRICGDDGSWNGTNATCIRKYLITYTVLRFYDITN